MKPKKKPCKAIGKAIGFQGCGKLDFYRTYGLGHNCGCYSKWLLNTPAGKEKLDKSILTGKKQVDQEKKKDWQKEKKQLLPHVYPVKYKNLLQSQINLLSRKIDAHFGYLCIDCDKMFGKQTDGAHFHNVSGHENIRFNLHNIHSARSDCNQYSSEHKTGYRNGIVKRYGASYLDHIDIEIPKKYKYLGLSEVEVFEKLAIVRKINREFEKLVKNTESDGAGMRDYFNVLIGVYKD